jgi:ribosome recycling factor
MTTINEFLQDGDARKKLSVEALKKTLGTFKTGRANPSLIESVIVDYYGASTGCTALG